MEIGFYPGYGDERDFVMKPNGAFNTTNDIIVNTYAISPNTALDCDGGKDRYIRSMSINAEDKLIIKQLSPSSFSNSDSTTYKWQIGSVAYNGTNLFLIPTNSNQSTFYVFKEDSASSISGLSLRATVWFRITDLFKTINLSNSDKLFADSVSN